MACRTLFSVLFVPILTINTAFSRNLSYIDADGVTETGGTPDKARMLPRTRADGRLDASLLPPLGSVVATPDPKRLYVSATVPDGGNGSVLAPFRTLQAALTNVMSGGAVVIAPGTYKASWTLPSAANVTLVGCGPSTVLDLTGTVEGGSDLTELRIVSAAVSAIRLYNGQARIRLLGTQVFQVDGSASPLTVVRSDPGSRVLSLTVPGAVERYDGNDTIPYAESLKGGPSGPHLTLSGTRPVIGDEIGAFLSDIDRATNALNTVIGTLRAVDDALVTAIEVEATLRESGDAAQSTALSNAVADLLVRISDVRSYWDGQLADLSGAVGTLSTRLYELAQTETSDVAALRSADALIRSDFRDADERLREDVSSEISDTVGDLEYNRLPGIADTRAQAVINLSKNVIISGAVTQAKVYSDAVDARVTEVVTTVNYLNTSVAGLLSHVSKIRAYIQRKHGDDPYQ